ncbi:MAG: glucosamine-6-phosphate deaminase [Flavitalea sp.]
MEVIVSDDKAALGLSAGAAAAKLIREIISAKGSANIILATGASQFATLEKLIAEKDIDWSKVTMFHLDEYIGLPITEPASFRKYLTERFLTKVPALKAAHLINGEGDAAAECVRLSKLITDAPIDVALVGIGENGHLAFNDPPADFDTPTPYIIVELDDQCRKQQYGEGWFKSVDDVPKKAISMSVKQILKSKHIICSVPDSRKAEAVKNSLEQKISNLFPASILQSHPDCQYFLDKESASLLSKGNLVK